MDPSRVGHCLGRAVKIPIGRRAFDAWFDRTSTNLESGSKAFLEQIDQSTILYLVTQQ